MKTLINLTLLTLIVLLSNCANKEDKKYLWLLGLAETTQATGAAGATGSSPNLGASTNPAPEGAQNFSISVNDVTGNSSFIFDTTRTIELALLVKDLTDTPATGAVVKFIDPTTGNVLFKAISSDTGNVKGSFTINSVTNEVDIELTYNDQSLHTKIDIKSVIQINRTFQMIATSTPIVVVDRDNDGMPDADDAFPDDPTRATTVKFPVNGYYTIAFEDLFPKQGDADFNDFVVRARYEEDLNAKGGVARVRAYYTHIAKGAGYNHIPRLTLPGTANSSYTIKRFTDAGVLEYEATNTVATFTGIDIFPASNTTIAISNTAKNQTFKAGKSVELEVIPSTPIDKLTLGGVPYDFYLYVINTKKEIHFAGKYFTTEGKDQYIDSVGFPWAILIPGDWKWPYETGNIHNSYQYFKPWYSSNGSVNKDWYNFPNLPTVFPLQ